MVEIRTKATDTGTFLSFEDGVPIPRVFTPETEQSRIQRFVTLCEDSHEVYEACFFYKERRDWNFAHPGQGKNWPVFDRCEKLLNKFQKEAGIVDT